MTASKDKFMGIGSQLKELIRNNTLALKVEAKPEVAQSLAEWIDDLGEILKDVPPETSDEVMAFAVTTIYFVVWLTEHGLLRSSESFLELVSKANIVLRTN